MTDGIIQELFNPIINILNSRMARITYSPKEVENIIKGLKKELIEKIQQEITTYGEPLPREIIYKILMGDNK